MDRTRISKAESIFNDVVAHDCRQRAALVAQRCGSDAELRRLVEYLLASDDSGMDGFLSRPAFVPPENGEPSSPIIPQRIGQYEIVRVIGEGGMGVVYEARQAHPSRIVALKVIRSALPSRDMLRRFRDEAQILAQLQHPGIAHIYEAAVVDMTLGGVRTEQPFFAMELIRGEPLRTFAQSRSLSVRDRLSLMAMICDAVQHAHEKGIIHRDLKSDNLLVEASGQPRILDFGVARIAASGGEGRTLQTRTGAIVGTLSYMSPEQVGGDPILVDTRSDVYSLGVILYELLTGSLPHDVRGLALADAAQRIRAEEPASIATLNRSLRGDVATIVARAIHKDRDRRYGSAAALASDIRRYLRNEPIEARCDSAVYVLLKNARRYRWPIAFAAAVVAGLACFAVYAWNQARYHSELAGRERTAKEAAVAATERERAAKEAAESASIQARAARDGEIEQRRLAESQARRAESVTTFLVDTLGLADPDVTQAPDMSMKTMLDRAAALVGGTFADQPDSEARVRLVIGRAYATLGELDAASEHLQRAVFIHETVLESAPEVLYEPLWSYVHVLDALGSSDYRNRWWQLHRIYPTLFKRASDELGACQSKLSGLLGAKYEQQSFEKLFPEFQQLSERTLKPEDALWLIVADFLHQGGSNLALKQHPAPGCKVLREALAIERRLLPETHTRIIRTLGELVRASVDAGHHDEAEGLTRESLELLRRSLPEDHWYVAVHRARLGACLMGQRRFDEAETLLLENLARIEAARGTTNAYAVEVVERLIDLYDAASQPEQADPWRRSLATRLVGGDQGFLPGIRLRRIYGAQYADLYAALERFYFATLLDRTALAQPLIELRRQQLPDDDVRAAVIAECLCSTADDLADRNHCNDQTLAMLREAERIARAAGHFHPRKHAWIIRNLARNLVPRKEFVEAECLAREALAIIETHFGENEGLGLLARSTLGAAILGQKRYTEAEPLILAEFRRRLTDEGADDEDTIVALTRLIELYSGLGRPADAMPFAYAVSRGRWLERQEVRPMMAALYPQLSEALDALSASGTGNRDRNAAALRAVLDARRAAFDIDDPAAMVYAGVLHRIARNYSSWTFDPLWIPAQEEARKICLAHIPADNRDLGTIVWWLATLRNRSGAFADAERDAREALRIVQIDRPDREGGEPTRDSPLAGALIGQGRFAEAESQLIGAFEALVGNGSVREAYGSECFGYVVQLYAATGRPEEALRLTEPVLRREIDRRDNAFLLRRLAFHVLVQPGLPDRLYELAAEAIRSAQEQVPKNRHITVLQSLADYRLGRFEDSIAGLERIKAPFPCDQMLHSAFLSMAHARLGRADRAAEALEAGRILLRDKAGLLTVQDRAVLSEAVQILRASGRN